MEIPKLKRDKSSYLHVDSNSAFTIIGESFAPQSPHVPKAEDELCPRFMRNSSYMKDYDLDVQLPSIQKENSNIFNDTFADAKLPDPDKKLVSVLPPSLSAETVSAPVKQENLPMVVKEEPRYVAPRLCFVERKVKVLIKEGKLMTDIKQEQTTSRTMDSSNDTQIKTEQTNDIEQSKSKLKKKAYTAEEDAKIVEYVKLYGDKNWSKIAELIPGRNRKQLRDHYINFLKNKLNKRGFTEKEDDIIFTMVTKYGHAWKKIADKLPGRTPIMIKNRYHSGLRKKVMDTVSLGSIGDDSARGITCSERKEKNPIDSVMNIIKDVTKSIRGFRIIPK